MTDNTLEYKNSTLFFKKSGNGPSVMLAFHGFGQDHSAFNKLALALADQYTFYAFDLFFHGKSTWGNGEHPIEKSEWKVMLERFLHENSINQFSLIGFSLGCRFVMAATEAFPDRTKCVFLLAPDGIKKSFWFTTATYPILLRKYFKSMILHPLRFKVIVNTLHELRLMNKGLLKFAEHQMNTEEKRKRVYYSWVVFRRLNVGLDNLTQLVNANHIRVAVVTGNQDKVITSKNIAIVKKRITNCRYEIINAGHAGMLKETDQLEKLITSETRHARK
jgi:pimeloyl-ACP methyl ester carboxylesterase